jgi:hypothetical protein
MLIELDQIQADVVEDALSCKAAYIEANQECGDAAVTSRAHLQCLREIIATIKTARQL